MRAGRGLAVVLLAALGAGAARAEGPDAAVVAEALADFERVCRADAGALWGEPLCAPVLVVEPASRRYVASQPPGAAGQLPPDVPAANTALEWNGTLWVQLLWPLPSDVTERRVLLVHEAFHRLQRRRGLDTREVANAHLDTAAGRTLLQLEWRALAKALESRAGARRRAVEDALAFRAARRARFPQAAAEEGAVEHNEGLAEYTGVRLGAGDLAARHALARRALTTAPGLTTLVRSFGYASGPAYGLLLDESARTPWRPRALAGEDVGALLARALGVRVAVPSGDPLARRGRAYGAPELERREAERERGAELARAALRVRFVEGAVLRLPLERMRIQFNPGELVPLEGVGTVYPGARITDAWGRLTARTGVLVDAQWKSAWVPLPLEARGATLVGDGWELELAPGWERAPGGRQGDLTLRRSASDAGRGP